MKTKNCIGLTSMLCLIFLNFSCGKDEAAKTMPPARGNGLKVQNAIPTPSGEELFEADIVTGTGNTFRLVTIDIYEEVSLKGSRAAMQILAKLSPKANLDHPAAILSIGGKDMDQLPEGRLNYSGAFPLDISRKDGKIVSDLYVDFTVYGDKAGYSDSKFSYSKNPRYSKFSELVDVSTRRREGSLHFYKISDDLIEIRETLSSSEFDRTISMEVRAVYKNVSFL